MIILSMKLNKFDLINKNINEVDSMNKEIYGDGDKYKKRLLIISKEDINI